MYWNYRFTKGTTLGTDYIRLQEVAYDDGDTPLGHCDISLYCDDPQLLARRIADAAALPVLDEGDL